MIARFVDHKYVLDLPGAREAYRGFFERALEHHDAEPLAYSYMSSHVHWSLCPGQMPLGSLFHRAHGGFAEWVRLQVGGLGSVFAGRYKNITFDPDLTGILIAYIHNNEARANLVPGPDQSRWSSHRFYRGDAPPPTWLRVDKGLELSGFDTSPSGRAQFHEFVVSRVGDPRSDAMTEPCAPDERLAALRQLVGTLDFLPTSRAPVSDERLLLLPPDHSWRGSVEHFVALACEVSGTTPWDLRSGCRQQPLPQIKGAFFLAWKAWLGRPLCELAHALATKESTASAAFTRARRDPMSRSLAEAIADTCLAAPQEPQEPREPREPRGACPQ